MARLNLYRLDDYLSVDYNSKSETVVLYDTQAHTPKRETVLSELQTWAFVTWWLDEHNLVINELEAEAAQSMAPSWQRVKPEGERRLDRLFSGDPDFMAG